MRILTLSLVALLAGCGVVYHSPGVREGVVDGAKVRIVEVTPQTVLAANSQGYNPRSLPAAFRASAGTYGSGGGMESLPSPAHAPEYRPGAMTTRLPPAVPNAPYRIGVGDVVLLATKAPGNTVSELSGLLAAENRRQGYTVQDDGTIAIPDVGRVRIADMTIEEAENTVFQRLVERQIDPTFSLEVAEFNARRVSIGGAVVNPGVAPVSLTPLTLDTAMAKAGGVNAADRDSAVIRIYREGSLYEVPVEEFLRNPDYQKIRLTDGDSVFVDTEYDLTKAEAYFEEQIRLSTTRASMRADAMDALSQEVAIRRSDLSEQRDNFQARVELGAEKRDHVYLSGEVGKPGRWPLPYEQTASLADALYDGGGVHTTTGNPKQIYILRGSPDPREFGGITAWHLDGSSATGMMMATRMQLRPDDVIFVAQQPVTKWDRVLDQISPSLITVPLDNALAQ
jgi:polysaccharide export outer membrane protein